MIAEPDPRLHRLLVRYWDGAITDAETDELEGRFLADPDAADHFQRFLVEAVTVADGAKLASAPGRDRRSATHPTARRRTVAWLAGLAVAAGVALAVGFAGDHGGSSGAGAAAVIANGSPGVRIQTARGLKLAVPGTPVFNGESVLVAGMAESANVSYSDGTGLTMTGETTITLADTPTLRQVMLQGGTIRANVAGGGSEPGSLFVFVTDELRAVAEPGTVLTLSRMLGRTEVEVLCGRARLFRRDGRSLPNASTGEVATLGRDGQFHRHGSHQAPEQYRWDLSRPLPAGWEAGRIESDPTARPYGRALVPCFWYDPCHGRQCWQIRSAKSWSSGLFRFVPDTRFRVRYRVDRPGAGQLLAVIRPEPSTSAGPGANLTRSDLVMLAPFDFTPAADGGWRIAEFTAADWIPERDAPDLSRSWMAFLVVFNTYGADLGLMVADFVVDRVSLPFPPEP